MSEVLFTGIAQLVLPHAHEQSRAPLRVLPQAFLWIRAGRVYQMGALHDMPAEATAERVDLGGRVVIPGLVDSHTHVCFAGARLEEMARRARGETYEQIAQAGGGIQNSVRALHAATQDDLVAQTVPRLQRMLRAGTTTLEIKSGYGLEPGQELKHLRAIAALSAYTPQDIFPTALAHVPPLGSIAALHAETFCRDIVAVAASQGLARFVDVFVEQGAFAKADARRIATAAQAADLRLKLHVDQLRNGQGALLAAELRAVSADHLEYTDAPGRAALAGAGVVATMLPGCGLFLGKGPWPDGGALRAAGCEVAVATDCNPGSSMVHDLLLCATLAATHCGLTLEEALWGVTRGGAKALGLHDRGCLAVGERADFAVLDHDDWRAALYYPAAVPIHKVVVAGAFAA